MTGAFFMDEASWLLPHARLTHDRKAAIDGNGRTGYEVRRAGGKKHRDAGEVGCRAPARRRRTGQHLVMKASDLFAGAPRQIGVDPSRQHRVDWDMVGGPGARARAVNCTMPPLLAA